MYVRQALIVLIVMVGAIVLSTLPYVTLAQNEDEEKLYDAVRGRINNIPKTGNVDRAIKSLDLYVKEFPCPEGSVDSFVRLRVFSILKGWDDGRAPHALGLYTIDTKPDTLPLIPSTDGHQLAKEVNFANEIRLNQKSMQQNEGSLAGKVANEYILYHELLHAQMFIDRAISEINKQLDDLCASKKFVFNKSLLGDTDAEHRMIDPLEDRYAKNNEVRGFEYFRRDNVTSAKPDGSFSFTVKLAKDLVAGARVACWISGNITLSPTTGDVGTDEITISGKITGKKPGFVKCFVDPPDSLEAVALTITPNLVVGGPSYFSVDNSGSSAVGIGALAGGAVGVLTILATSYWYVRRRWVGRGDS